MSKHTPGTVIHLKTSNVDPDKRACCDCLYGHPRPNTLSRCKALNSYIEYERTFESYACGKSGKMWKKRPPPPPSRGLVTWLRDALFEGWKP